MRAYEKRKAIRQGWKIMAAGGNINRADGSWAPRSQVKDDSMKRDYYPQEGKK